MLRQILASLVVLAGAAVAYIMFVPGASDMLARFGVALPTTAVTAEAAQSAGGPGAGTNPGAQRSGRLGPGGPAGGRGGGRDLLVVTAPVGSGTINNRLTALGEGEAAHSVVVVSPASGTLRELAVRPGQEINAGAMIGRLDAEAEQIAFERATLAKNDADAALERTLGLSRANSATTVQLTAAQLASDNAALELQNAELALERRTITSPIAGRVGLFQVSPGNAVSAQTVVTTIEDTEHILISFWVPERYVSSVRVGLPVVASAVALPGESIVGEVVAVDNRIDPASRTLKVQAKIPNGEDRLRPGMSFSVAMTFEGETFPTVDPLAIQWSSAGAYVWKYADGQVSQLFVEIVQRGADGVLVNGDIAAGDEVVTQGVQQLVEGASVRLLDDVLNGGADGPPGQRRAGI